MARALWSGSISFGLLNIPAQLMPGERRMDLQVHLMDTRNRARVHYQRINEETGDEVPWKDNATRLHNLQESVAASHYDALDGHRQAYRAQGFLRSDRAYGYIRSG